MVERIDLAGLGPTLSIFLFLCRVPNQSVVRCSLTPPLFDCGWSSPGLFNFCERLDKSTTVRYKGRNRTTPPPPSPWVGLFHFSTLFVTNSKVDFNF